VRLSRLLFAVLLALICIAPATGVSQSTATAGEFDIAMDRPTDQYSRATRSAERTPEAVDFALLARLASTTTSTTSPPVATPTTEVPTTQPLKATTTSTTAPVVAKPSRTAATKSSAAKAVTTGDEAPAEGEADKAATNTTAEATTTATGKEGVVQIARAQVGKTYRSGATGPDAFDCSGLVFYVFNQAGISVPRLTSDGYFAAAAHISRSELQPGDLVVGRGHIGIYVGGGQMVHASTPRGGVKLAPIDVVPSIGYGRL